MNLHFTVKNWRWWVVLPYLLILGLFAILILVVAFPLKYVSELLLSVLRTNSNLFYIKSVKNFVKSKRS
jgi:hypothetical protein